MAKSKAAKATAGAFKIFAKPGKTEDRIAIAFGDRVVIESDGPGKFFIYMDGIRHVIASDDTLEELTAAGAADAVQD